MPLFDPEVPCNHLVAVGELNSDLEQTTIELASGMKVSIPTIALLERATFSLQTQAEFGLVDATPLTIPVIAEEIVVTKRNIPLETVRLIKSSEVATERHEVSLASEHWDIARVPMNTEIAERTSVRREGDVTIYPVFEERVITRKALFLTEELHIRRRTEITQQVVEADVLRESVSVEKTKH